MTEKTTRTNRRYTEEFISEAIKLALSSPSITGTAKSLGIPDATLHTWVKTKSINNKKNKNNINSKSDVNNLLEENRKLHKELARLKQEKEILKKAAMYFAQELS